MTLGALGLGFALVCAGLMGFAIQRGATCMVAAIDEIVSEGRCSRTLALAEAAIWVAAALIVLKLGGLAAAPVSSHPPGVAVAVGGVLLGWGALINRACMFGTIARLGSGEWAFAATPLGFFAGCLAGAVLLASPAMVLTTGSIPTGLWPTLVLAAAAALASWRLRHGARAALARRFAAHLWSPHQATLVIALTFVGLMTVAGAWTYTDWLAALSRHGMRADLAQGLLFLALLGGSVIGGYSSGRMARRPLRLADVARSFAGGAAMGLGGVLVPGGNDGLILVGLPFLQPYALMALLTMATTIAAGLALRRPNVWGRGTTRTPA